MTEPLPHFPYHPDPVATGAVVASDKQCVCCERSRGYVYVGSVYSTNDLDDALCPWCIADGSAASRLDASFGELFSRHRALVPESVIAEVNLRTPGYVSWQGESWLSHCNDACEFHGDATAAEVADASNETKNAWMEEYKQDEASWLSVVDGYRPAGHSALYKFVCRHCRRVLFGWDLC
ncbi:MAG: hypothetical protein HC910_18785 [Spirulinaceae cyanobacterium SM2_1_0]|nr:hypothetical protein [Spirulinaceae cyanobacterium SM2_1_0]